MQIIHYSHIPLGKEYLGSIISQQTELYLNFQLTSSTTAIYNITNFLITNEFWKHLYHWWTLKRTESHLSLVMGGNISLPRLKTPLPTHYLNPYCYMSLFGLTCLIF